MVSPTGQMFKERTGASLINYCSQQLWRQFGDNIVIGNTEVENAS